MLGPTLALLPFPKYSLLSAPLTCAPQLAQVSTRAHAAHLPPSDALGSEFHVPRGPAWSAWPCLALSPPGPPWLCAHPHWCPLAPWRLHTLSTGPLHTSFPLSGCSLGNPTQPPPFPPVWTHALRCTSDISFLMVPSGTKSITSPQSIDCMTSSQNASTSQSRISQRLRFVD